jgi:hypothetical protein
LGKADELLAAVEQWTAVALRRAGIMLNQQRLSEQRMRAEEALKATESDLKQLTKKVKEIEARDLVTLLTLLSLLPLLPLLSLLLFCSHSTFISSLTRPCLCTSTQPPTPLQEQKQKMQSMKRRAKEHAPLDKVRESPYYCSVVTLLLLCC